MSPPTSGNTAQTAASLNAGPNGRRKNGAVATVVAEPMSAAGAGPSSTIASTTAKNAPEIWRPRISTVIASLAMASPKSTETSASGCQSAVSRQARRRRSGAQRDRLDASMMSLAFRHDSPVIGRTAI